MEKVPRRVKRLVKRSGLKLLRSLGVLKRTVQMDKGVEFNLFTSLPQEIQRKIWVLASPEPAYITFSIETVKPFLRRVPAILHACKESRDIFLQEIPIDGQEHPYYELLTIRAAHNSYKIYVSYKHDVFEAAHLLLLRDMAMVDPTGQGEIARRLPREIFERARNIALVDPLMPSTIPNRHRSQFGSIGIDPYLLREITTFPGVTSITLITNHPFVVHYRQLMLPDQSGDIAIATAGAYTLLGQLLEAIQGEHDARSDQLQQPRVVLKFKLRFWEEVVWG